MVTDNYRVAEEAASCRDAERSLSRLLTAALTLGCFSVVMSATTINVAITPMMRDLSLEPRVAQLFSSVFLGLTVVVAPVTAWLADRFGPWRVFFSVLMVYSVISLLGLLVTGFVGLLLVRMFQGICAGIIQPLSLFLLLEYTPAHRHGRAMSMFGLGVVMAPALGPAFAGWAVDYAGWQSVFALGALPACLAALMALLAPDTQSDDVSGKDQTGALDWAGILLLAFLVAGIFLWPFAWAESSLAGVLSGGVWLLGVWLFWMQQCRSPASLIPVNLFRQPEFRRAAMITVAYGTGMYGSVFLIPLMLQQGLGVSATTTGNFLLVGGIALALTIASTGRLVDRYSPARILVLGLMSFTVSCLIFSLSDNLVVLAVAIVLSRVGLGSIIPSLYSAIARSVPAREVRHATAAATFLRQGGGALGIVLLGLSVSWLTVLFEVAPANFMDIYGWLFGILALLFAGAGVLALGLRT